MVKLSIAPYWNWNAGATKLNEFDEPLSIAPYWNWNFAKIHFQPYRIYFQSHHTGIEMGSTHSSSLLSTSFQSHHTGIEMLMPAGLNIKRWTFNRTILELKYSHIQSGPAILGLSIAPYWNWNFLLVFSTNLIYILSIAPYWNWNIGNLQGITPSLDTFNRTILELKFVSSLG